MTDAPLNSLRGKHALVTGAGSGIGRALAVALAAAGSHVSLLGRTESSLKATGKLCGAGNTECWTVDLADTAGIEKFVSEFAPTHPTLHILVHAAGAFARLRLDVGHSAEARN